MMNECKYVGNNPVLGEYNAYLVYMGKASAESEPYLT